MLSAPEAHQVKVKLEVKSSEESELQKRNQRKFQVALSPNQEAHDHQPRDKNCTRILTSSKPVCLKM